MTYFGRVCSRHPEDKGLRYLTGGCVACRDAAGDAWAQENEADVRARLENSPSRMVNLGAIAPLMGALAEESPNMGRVHCAKRRCSKLQRTPRWANVAAIERIYADAGNLHVDHIIPLQGRLVSGLHVANNLQLLPASENCRKGNRFDPDSYVHEIRIQG